MSNRLDINAYNFLNKGLIFNPLALLEWSQSLLHIYTLVLFLLENVKQYIEKISRW